MGEGAGGWCSSEAIRCEGVGAGEAPGGQSSGGFKAVDQGCASQGQRVVARSTEEKVDFYTWLVHSHVDRRNLVYGPHTGTSLL